MSNIIIPCTFKKLLPVTINPADPVRTIVIDVSGVGPNDYIVAPYMIVGQAGQNSSSGTFNEEHNVAQSGYGTGNMMFGFPNGTDTEWVLGFTDGGAVYNPTGLSIACVAAVYSGPPLVDPYAGQPATQTEFGSAVWASSFSPGAGDAPAGGPIAPPTTDDLLFTAQMIQSDVPTLGSVDAPFTLRGGSQGSAWTHNASDGLGITTPSPMYAQVQIADVGGVTTTEDPVWRNDATAQPSTGRSIGYAFWLIQHASIAAATQRFILAKV